MEFKWNRLLVRQIKRRFGSLENLPNELKDIFIEINNAYENFEDDAQLLQNSIEISSQELRDAFQKLKHEAEVQKETLTKVNEAILVLDPNAEKSIEGMNAPSADSSHLFRSLIKLIEEHKQIEIQLKDSENLQRSLLENVAVGIVIIDQETRTIDNVNTFGSVLIGEPKENIIGRRCHQFLCPAQEQCCPVCDKGQDVDNAERVLLRTGKSAMAVLKTVKQIQIDGRWKLLESFVDITVQKEAEAALQQSSKKWEAIIAASPDGIGMASLDGKLQLMSEKLALMYGYSIEQKGDFLNKTIFDFIDPTHHEILKQNIQKLIAGENKQKITEYLAIKRDNSRIYVDVNSTILHDINGMPESILFVERDITERKQVEEALKSKTSLLEAQKDATIDAILVVDNNQRRILINQRVVEMFGVPQDILDNNDDSLLLKHVVALTKKPEQFLEKVMYLYHHPSETSQDEIEFKSGMILDRYSAPVLGQDGKNYGRIWTFRNITERKLAEEEQIRQSGLITSLLDSIPDMIFFKDKEGVYMGGNPAFAEFANRSRDEIAGITDYELFPKEIADSFREHDKHMMATRQPSHNDIWITYPDGRKALVDTLKTPYLGPDGNLIGVLGISRNITSRKQAEEAMKQISTRLALATRAGGVGVWDLDIANNSLLWDDQMFAHYGMKKEDFGGVYEAWIAGLHPEDKGKGDAEIQMAIRGEKEFDTEFRVVWPDGTVHNIRALATVQRSESGKPLRLVGTNWDITQQKNNEAALIKAKQEADVATKSKSEFLANMSHEIRTPLNGVIGFTDLLQKTPLNKIQRQYADNVNASGHALLGIINDILDFSKIEAGKMELDIIKTDIIELVEHTSDIIKYHASQKGLELLLNIQPNIPRFALADPIRLKQILVNLISNAVKFTETGEVELKLTFEKVDYKTGKFNFSVRDTGIGINEEQQKRLFRAFTQADSSTTRKFGGTGLGLTISNVLAEKMGSKIDIHSEIGKGSTFYFTIETGYEIGEKHHNGSLTDIQRVLVIDDNDNNRLILEHTFNDWGIEFVGIDNGLSALKIIERSQPFDVIIVDYHMPYLNGLDTIRMIREQLILTAEKQPVILLHSSSDDVGIYDECKKLGVRFNLTKPVKSQELLHYLMSLNAQPTPEFKDREVISTGPIIGHANENTPVIIVAEDNILNMMLITTIIKQMISDVIIFESKTGRDALNMAMTESPSMILMDIQMPEMSGLEATEEIRKYEQGRGTHIPIVALTAGAVTGEREKCLKAGMDDFLTKPVDREALMNMLEKYLAKPNLDFFNGAEVTPTVSE